MNKHTFKLVTLLYTSPTNAISGIGIFWDFKHPV